MRMPFSRSSNRRPPADTGTDWAAAGLRLAAAVAVSERRGLKVDYALAARALMLCVQYADEGEPEGKFLQPNEPPLGLVWRHGLSLDWLLFGDPRR